MMAFASQASAIRKHAVSGFSSAYVPFPLNRRGVGRISRASRNGINGLRNFRRLNWIDLQPEKCSPALREKVCVESTSFFDKPD